MAWVSFTNLTLLGFLAYMSVTVKTFYDLFNPELCSATRRDPNKCIYSMTHDDFALALCVVSTSRYPKSRDQCTQFIVLPEFRFNESFSKYNWCQSTPVPQWFIFTKEIFYKFYSNLTLELPSKTRQNGTLYSYAVLTKKSNLALNGTFQFSGSTLTVLKELRLSQFRLNRSKTFVNLLTNKGDVDESSGPKKPVENKPITHLLTKLTLSTLDDGVHLDRHKVPEEIYNDLIMTQKGEFLPIMHVNRLTVKNEHYKPLEQSDTEFILTVEYSPISIGMLRLFKQLEASLDLMKNYGINDAQLNEITSLFTDTNLYLLILTFFVSIFHMLFEFLAFKNDINFWRKRKTMVGLSIKALTWRFISQVIIFVYLMEEQTSLLITVPSGISIFIELWKLFKAFKVQISFQEASFMPKLNFGEASKEEKLTNEIDSMAMKYLSYVLYPLCIGGAIYSLVYNTHKNWYSWVINSLVNGVYAFGFLFMTPQLFLNYKLKSVAHLPWKAFMYKAFNTFIDDVFAFIIVMPTMHRLACLRDDVVFIIYLYQRWLYPIDKTRVNEFGESFDNDEQAADKDKQKAE